MTKDLFVRPYTSEEQFRNPARISYMIQLMLAVWAQEDNTDMRMGQLLINAARFGGWSNDDIFHCEDEFFAKGFLEMLKKDIEK